MLILQIVVLALIQGITEFLPISSSGHLLLVPVITGWPDQGVLTDVMVHMGSFLAVVVYFWKDCVNLLTGFIDMLRGRKNAWGRLALLIVLGTITVLMKLVRHISFLPFAVYRVALGVVLLALIYSGMPLGAVN